MVSGIVLAFMSIISPFSHAEEQRLPIQGFSDIVQAVGPAVVFIVSEGNDDATDSPRTDPPLPSLPLPFPPYEVIPQERSGSGIVIDSNGYIVTNSHVVKGATEVTVTLSDRRVLRGTIVGTDPQTDLAVVAVNDTHPLPSLGWSDSDQVKVGDLVLAIGSPFGLTQTVTMGIISALGRGNVGIVEYEDFIQTDAAINPGNSGGPLVNMDGKLIGINTAIFSQTGSSEGIGFAIPSNIAQHVVNSLIQRGSVIRGWLGVSIQDMTPALTEAFGLQTMKGALISQVLTDSPAEKAGLQQGDIIIRYANKPIDNVSQIRNAVAQSQVGTSVDILVVRDGQKHSTQIIVATRPTHLSSNTDTLSREIEGVDNVLTDLHVRNLDVQTLERLDLPPDTVGVFIEAVRPNSPADREGLIQGDVIQQIRFEGTQVSVASVTDFHDVRQKLGKDDIAILLIHRRGGSMFVPLKP